MTPIEGGLSTRKRADLHPGYGDSYYQPTGECLSVGFRVFFKQARWYAKGPSTEFYL